MNIPQFLRLIRLRTLTAAFSPVILGTLFAVTLFPSPHTLGENVFYSALMLICVLCAQMSANIWNEYCDFKSGLDLHQKVGNSGSIVREGLSPSTILQAGYVTTGIAFITGIILCSEISWWFLPVGSLCILVALLYSGGPLPISRTPYGELASGLTMGFVIVVETFYSWTLSLTWEVLIPAIPSLILIGSIMMTNNLRDIENDRNHGRRTLAIVLGKEKGIALLRNAFLFCQFWLVLWALLGFLPHSATLALISIIPAMKAVKILSTYVDTVHLNEAMKFSAITCTLYHVLFALGLWIG